MQAANHAGIKKSFLLKKKIAVWLHFIHDQYFRG